MQQTINLKIVGDNQMHCGGCERNVKLMLELLEGVETVTADHKTQHIAVTLSGETPTVHSLRNELADLGYEAISQEAGSE